MEQIIRHTEKYINLFLNEYLEFFEKFMIILSLHRRHMLQRIILKRLRNDKNGPAYFDFGKYRIYFRPSYSISDEKYFLKGIVALLEETFIFPEYFHSVVNLKIGDVVLDLGANIGTTSLLFSSLVGNEGKIFSFEPVTNDVLQINKQMNNANNIEIIPKCVSNENGKVEIEISDYCLDSSIARRKYTEKYYQLKKEVDCVTLDSFAREKGLDRIDFIKMDIEGAEELALKGGLEMIKKFRPKLSISSYHIDFNNKPQHKSLLSLLKSLGYKINEIPNYHIYAW